MAKETLNHAEIFCLLVSPKLKLNVVMFCLACNFSSYSLSKMETRDHDCCEQLDYRHLVSGNFHSFSWLN